MRLLVALAFYHVAIGRPIPTASDGSSHALVSEELEFADNYRRNRSITILQTKSINRKATPTAKPSYPWSHPTGVTDDDEWVENFDKWMKSRRPDDPHKTRADQFQNALNGPRGLGVRCHFPHTRGRLVTRF